MAPPKMYRKMSRNNPARTGGMTSSCGVRANCKRVRRAVWAVVVRKLALASEEGAGVMRSVAEVRVRGLGGNRPEHLLDGGEVPGRSGSHREHIAAGQGLELVGRARRDDLAVIDDHDVAGQLIGFLEVLGGEQDIGAAGDEIADRTPQLHAAARVQAGGRLVEQQELGA